MTNLRQQIEEIQSNKSCRKSLCNKYSDLNTDFIVTNCVQCQTDRICEAIKAKVEEMPRLLTTTDGGDFAVGANHGVMCQHNSDKSYLMGELK